jgi:hypothetical protein
MWCYEFSSEWKKHIKHYEKKHSDELAAVLANLKRFEEQLANAKNSKCVQAGFIHNEPSGVVAIDQKGQSKNKLQETRLYLFVDDSSKTIHLLAIGDKAEQSDDIEYCKKYVAPLKLGDKQG